MSTKRWSISRAIAICCGLWVISAKSKTLAYPYGETTPALKTALPPRYRTARGIMPGLNVGRIDLAHLRAFPLYGESLKSARRLLKPAARRRAWMVVFTHDVTETPSPWGTTPEQLENVRRRRRETRLRHSSCHQGPGACTRMKASILIPTFRRPEGLKRAVRSALAQKGVESFEIVVVDNSPDSSAAVTLADLAREARVPFRFKFEPQPGVAHARNAALAMADGDLIAWLDDDQEASPCWLYSLIETRYATGAQSVFGPVYAHAPVGAKHGALAERLYSRLGSNQSGVTERSYGIGNSLQPRMMYDVREFDVRANETGGEDDALFAAWSRAGATYAWAADAIVIEFVETSRAKLAHGLKRAFAYGQGPCETAWKQRDYPALARHMGVGAAQAVAFGAGAGVAALTRSRRATAMLDRAARGAGKVFWFYEQRFYGKRAAR